MATRQRIGGKRPASLDHKWSGSCVLVFYAGIANAAAGDPPEWIQWAVLGAIALLVVGVLLRMIIAARFPKGYGAWARSRRDTFAESNAKWETDDERRR